MKMSLDLSVYSRDIWPKAIKIGAYVISLDEYADVGTHWIALYATNNEVIYFDSFGVEHVPNIFRIQTDNSIMCGYFFIGLIDFMFEDKSLIDFTSLFSPYYFKKKKR